MLFLVALILVTIFLYLHFTKNNDYWEKRNVPGPKPTFFFGNVRDQALRKKAACEMFTDICGRYPEEKVIGIFRMRSPELLVTDLDVIKHILIKDFDIFTERGIRFAENNLGANLFHAKTATWRVLRSKFTPLFSSGKLKNMTYLMDELADRWLDYVDEQVESQPKQDFHRLAKKFTQSAIASCAFGIDIYSFDDELADALYQVDQKIVNNTFRHELEMMYPGILTKFGSSLFPNDVNSFFHNLTKKVIAFRHGEPIGRNDFMDLILALRKEKKVVGSKIRDPHDESKMELEMTDEIIAAQSFVFFFAGNETSALAVGYLLRALALYPEIQNKVEAELRQVLQKHGRKLTYDTVADLTYLEKVLHETLRLYLVAESVRRCPSVDYKIPGTDIIVKKGQIMVIPLNVVHRDPEQFPDPDQFDPERFSPENVAARHSCAYLPFGLGPRQCIGYRFARLQTMLCAAKILSKYRVELSESSLKPIKYIPARLAQKPVGGFPLNLIKRQL